MSLRPYEVLAAQRLLPVLRSDDADGAVRATVALLAAGCRAVELTTTTPGWAGAVARAAGLTDARGRPALIGTGTVTTAADAEAALDAGAGFLVSPYPAPEVREVAERRGAAFVEGGFTPGEIAAAVRRSGAAKVFPAHVGGPAFLRSLRAVLPGAVLIPTGGIAPGEVRDWLAAGATAVGVGSGLPADPAELASLFASLAADPAGTGSPKTPAAPFRSPARPPGSETRATVRGGPSPSAPDAAPATPDVEACAPAEGPPGPLPGAAGPGGVLRGPGAGSLRAWGRPTGSEARPAARGGPGPSAPAPGAGPATPDAGACAPAEGPPGPLPGPSGPGGEG